MLFHPTKLEGVWLIELDRREDERGYFARAWCQEEFAAHGLSEQLIQCNVSFNHRAGTLRGMHFQTAPHEEAKVVRCTRGGLFDVALDVRSGSPTRRQWVSFELTPENGRMLYIPPGCAHGFQTLDDDTEVFYFMSTAYHPECQRGVRWNDPAFGIRWPRSNPILSERDAGFPDFAC